ncbi:hypothetical protein, partial [Streptomyces mirabilis]
MSAGRSAAASTPRKYGSLAMTSSARAASTRVRADAGLLLPRDRNKTLTCLAGAEPVAGAQHAAVQRL